MSLRRRHRCLLVLIAVVIGQAALTLHASGHAALEQQTCQLCVHYSDLGHAFTPPAPELFAGNFDTPEPLPPAVVFRTAVEPSCCHPRAPPAAS